MIDSGNDEVVQRSRDDLLTAVRSAARQVENVRSLLAELNGDVEQGDWNSAQQSLWSVESGLTTIEQHAVRWGAR